MKSRRGRRESFGRFIALPHFMAKSAAFRSLPGTAVKILIDIWLRHNGANNGTISYGVREAGAIGVNKSTAQRMMQVLVDRGFLVVTRNSAFTLKTKESRLWRLTAEKSGDDRPTNDFMRWQPSGENPSMRKPKHGPSVGTRSPPQGTPKTKQPVSVPSPGPSVGENGVPQSPCRDTSTLPCGVTSRSGALRKETINGPASINARPLELEAFRVSLREALKTDARGAVTALAVRAGISTSHLSNFLWGRRNIDAYAALALQEYLTERYDDAT